MLITRLRTDGLMSSRFWTYKLLSRRFRSIRLLSSLFHQVGLLSMCCSWVSPRCISGRRLPLEFLELEEPLCQLC